MNVKVHVDGTLNKRDDQDKGWTVEMAIPLEDVRGPGQGRRPSCRRRRATCGASTCSAWTCPRGKPQQASAWSPPMVGDFHALDKFGDLVFGDEKGNVPPRAVPTVAGRVAPMTGAGTGGKEAAKEPAALRGKPAGDQKKTAGSKAVVDSKGSPEKK